MYFWYSHIQTSHLGQKLSNLIISGKFTQLYKYFTGWQEVDNNNELLVFSQ